VKALALLLLVSLSVHAAEPLPLRDDAPRASEVKPTLAVNAVPIRVGEEVPFDGVLTEEGEYIEQAKGVAALRAERDALSKRPPLWLIITGGVALVAVGIAAGWAVHDVTKAGAR
jgi:hypothetical protein